MISDLERAARLIRQAELVAFPTETVYGLGASLWSEAGILKIFQAKGRPADNPLIVHLFSLEQLSQVAVDIPDELYKLAEAFWPGPLTCILKRASNVSKLATAGLETVAVRIPSHPIARALLKAVGEPMVAPSANLSGRPSPTSAAHVLQDFESIAVLDGGECELGIESTVVNLCEEVPVILRPGTITKEQLEEVLEREVLLAAKGAKVASPGMKYRHYAPECPVVIACSDEEWEKKRSITDGKKRLFLDSFTTKSLYALLRRADTEEYEEVVVRVDESIQADLALMNRLLKAASPT